MKIFHPLELADNYHINIWSEDDTHKWSIAYFVKGKEGYYLQFVGDRPFDPRVNWGHLKILAKFAQEALDLKFDEEKE